MNRSFFAYGPVFEHPTFAGKSAPQLAEAVGQALVYDVPSSEWGGRTARLVARPDRSLWGLLHEVPEDHWKALKALQTKLLEQPTEVEVTLQVDGQQRKATTWVSTAAPSRSEGPVSLRFVQALILAAEKAKLPEVYLVQIKAEALILERLQRPST